MKTRILTLAFAVLISVSAIASEKNDSISANKPNSGAENQLSISKIDKDIVGFRMLKGPDDVVILKVYTDKGIKVYHRKIRQEDRLALNCDLSNMRSGTYTFVVEKNKREVLRKDIQIDKSSL